MLKILIAAIFLSILSCIIFLYHDVGISLIIFLVSFLGISLFLLKQNKRIKNKKYLLLTIPILLLASTYFIFQNRAFYTLNFIVIFTLIVIMFIGLLSEHFNFTTLFGNSGNLLLGSVDSAEDIKEILDNKKIKISFNTKILKAVLITIPIIIIVFILLSKSEILFSNMIDSMKEFMVDIINADFKNIVQRIAFVLIGIVIFTLFLYNIINNYEEEQVEEYSKKELKDILTFKILLISLNIIYLVYIVLQLSTLINYLINGGISDYAEYARSGFFELMGVSFINLIIILITFKYKSDNKLLKILNTIMLVFTFILIISAFCRMRFYERVYGYTILRLLVYFILVMEAVIIIPTIIYVWKNNFSIIKVYSIIILAGYIILNFINLDYIIARENINRYFKNGKIDINYLLDDLGPDAYLEIIRLENDDNFFFDIKDYKYYAKTKIEEWDDSIWSFNITREKIRNSLN